jgi:coenzyme F420-dependent glucose-6-phosphate dehydrogenase
MVEFGWFASLEEFTPRACLEQVDLAAGAGFDAVWVNDHFHPWFDHLEDGTDANGGNCWSWMPAALERTEDIRVGSGVSALIHRYHPGNVAHQLATLCEMYPDRLFFGVGTGEALNESPLGLPMPEWGECAKRTAEGVRMIRTLFEGEFVDFEGKFWELDGANLYTGPDEAPPIWIAANGPTAARMAGDLGDGFVTVFEPPERLEEELFPAVRDGVAKSERNDDFEEVPTCIHVHVSYDPDSRDAAMEPCLPWRGTQVERFFYEDVADPRVIQEEGEELDPEALVENPGFVVTTDFDDVVAETRKYVEAGFDEVVYQSHCPDQQLFADLVEERIMPEFA